MNNGYNRLARTLGSQISKQTASPNSLELGTLQDDMSLKIDRYSIPLPPGEYLTCQGTGALVPGSRVLIAWVNDGTDPVIVDVVVVT